MPEMNSLHALFEKELRDLYDAEKQIIKALPKMIKGASNEQLSEALSMHLEETKGHVERLESVFESLDMKARGKHCAGMEGLLEEGSELLKEDGPEAVPDAGIISSAQRVEHYEITAYGTLMAWAKLMGHKEALALLKQNEQEEKAADVKLSKLAESMINREALDANPEMDEEEEMAGAGRGR